VPQFEDVLTQAQLPLLRVGSHWER
jgi:hypothetical protein